MHKVNVRGVRERGRASRYWLVRNTCERGEGHVSSHKVNVRGVRERGRASRYRLVRNTCEGGGACLHTQGHCEGSQGAWEGLPLLIHLLACSTHTGEV